MITAAQAKELERLHEVVNEALRFLLITTKHNKKNWFAASEACGRAEAAFTAYLATLTEPQP